MRGVIVALLLAGCAPVDDGAEMRAVAVCAAFESCGEEWTPGQREWCVANTVREDGITREQASECAAAIVTTECETLWAGDLPEECAP